jgi:uroporphyrinogen-III synthase
MNLPRRPVVALPETRQLDVLANLLERREVDVVRCPMIAIKDAPDAALVVAWLERFCAGSMDLLIVYTGEGIRRLIGFAERAGLREGFVAALATTPLLTRGPKPVRALRELGIRQTQAAAAPTTAGVLATLQGIAVEDKRIGIQLYGSEPLPELTAALENRGAEVDPVAPYVYASESDDAAVRALIERLALREIDAIAFTSKAQVERLAAVAAGAGETERLQEGLRAAVVAAVGPVAARELEDLGVRVDVVPESDYFMKPMVMGLMARLAALGRDAG